MRALPISVPRPAGPASDRRAQAAQPGAAAEIAVVVSNVAGAGGRARAESAGIATTVINHKKFPNRESATGSK